MEPPNPHRPTVPPRAAEYDTSIVCFHMSPYCRTRIQTVKSIAVDLFFPKQSANCSPRVREETGALLQGLHDAGMPPAEAPNWLEDER